MDNLPQKQQKSNRCSSRYTGRPVRVLQIFPWLLQAPLKAVREGQQFKSSLDASRRLGFADDEVGRRLRARHKRIGLYHEVSAVAVTLRGVMLRYEDAPEVEAWRHNH